MHAKRLLCAIASVLLALVGCTTTLDVRPIEHSLYNREYEDAYEQVVDAKTTYLDSSGPLIYALDKGMIAHWANLYEESNEAFDEAELLIQHLYTESILANIGSYLVSETTRPYSGEDYEDIYLTLFKALNYIQQQDIEAAQVELRRFNEKQQFLQHKYDPLLKKSQQASSYDLPSTQSMQFSSSALGNYLSMIVHDALKESDQADFSHRKVIEAFETQQQLYPFALPKGVEERSPVEKNRVRLHLIAFSGLSPKKVSFVERFWYTHNTYVKVALPQMLRRPTRVAEIEYIFSNGQSGTFEIIEDVGLVALETFKLNVGAITSRTLLRSILKATGTALIEGTTQVMAEATDDSDTALAIEVIGSFVSFFSRIYNEVSEQADLRVSHFFPDRSWVAFIDVPPGVYSLKVNYKDRRGNVIDTQYLKEVITSERGLNLIELYSPY